MKETNTPVTNPALKQANARLHGGEHAREHQMITLQMLLQAQLLAPVTILPDEKNTQLQC